MDILNTITIGEIQKNVDENKEYINHKIGKHPNYPKIIIIGDVDSGKTTVKNLLLNNKCMIIQTNRNLELQFVDKNNNKIIKNEMITTSKSLNLHFIECPALDSGKELKEQIIDALTIDTIIGTSGDTINKMKILLVISVGEFESRRGKGILEKIFHIFEIFPNISQNEEAFGLVITKTQINCSAQDYLLRLQNRAPPEMKGVCDFFLKHPNQVFVITAPTYGMAGNRYEFDDHENLIQFVRANYAHNLIHKAKLYQSSESELKGILARQSHMKDRYINDLFSKLAEKYQKENTIDGFQRWIDTIIQMKDIQKTVQLQNFVHDNFPDIPNIDSKFSEIEEYEVVRNSIYNLFNIDIHQSFIQYIIIDNIQKAINQLGSLQQKTNELGMKKTILEQMTKVADDMEKQFESQKKKFQDIQNQVDKASNNDKDAEHNNENVNQNEPKINISNQADNNFNNLHEEDVNNDYNHRLNIQDNKKDHNFDMNNKRNENNGNHIIQLDIENNIIHDVNNHNDDAVLNNQVDNDLNNQHDDNTENIHIGNMNDQNNEDNDHHHIQNDHNLDINNQRNEDNDHHDIQNDHNLDMNNQRNENNGNLNNHVTFENEIIPDLTNQNANNANDGTEKKQKKISRIKISTIEIFYDDN